MTNLKNKFQIKGIKSRQITTYLIKTAAQPYAYAIQYTKLNYISKQAKSEKRKHT